MIKLKKSEAYLVDNNEKLLNKLELHQLVSEKNKKIGDFKTSPI